MSVSTRITMEYGGMDKEKNHLATLGYDASLNQVITGGYVLLGRSAPSKEKPKRF